jgi:hypothetical protein
VELAAGLMLLLGWRTRAGALLIVGMMSVFTLALVIAALAGAGYVLWLFCLPRRRGRPHFLGQPSRETSFGCSFHCSFFSSIGLIGALMPKHSVKKAQTFRRTTHDDPQVQKTPGLILSPFYVSRVGPLTSGHPLRDHHPQRVPRKDASRGLPAFIPTRIATRPIGNAFRIPPPPASYGSRRRSVV